MSSSMHGLPTLGVEVSNVSSHGIWLLTNGSEFFLSYDDFPWFKNTILERVLNVEQPSPGHFYWPDLDVDIGLSTIEHPDRYPLKSK